MEPKGHAICKNFISFVTHLIGEGGSLYLLRGFVCVANIKAKFSYVYHLLSSSH